MADPPDATSLELRRLVAASDAVSATAARNEKVGLIAELLRETPEDEIGVVVGLISGNPRQGRIGVGWATIANASAEPAGESRLVVADLDALLDDLGSTTGAGSQQDRRSRLARFLSTATEAEAAFVRRLLIGELRQGANEGVVTTAVAKAAGVPVASVRRAAMLTGDLAEAAQVAVRSGRTGLDDIGLAIFRPVLPMLASTAASPQSAIEELGDASVEWKLDGIRIQVHRAGDTVRVWTRNLNEITGGVPSVVEAVRALNAQSLILDGEVLGLDAEGRPVPFQDTASGDQPSYPFFFDLLHHDGEDLLDVPLIDRFHRLRAVVGPLAVPGVVTSDPEEAQATLARALDEGHEGVVIKAADSPYQAGRRGKAWRKVKPVHTLDLVVLAVEHGSGRRRGWLSNIHLGARDPMSGGFVMVGKTFKGMTDDTLRWQTERFSELAVTDDGRTVIVRPEQVVEIAIDGVQRSTRYPGGAALRFARVVRYRNDKLPQDADTIDTVRSFLR
ncbi:MAG: ATP-dependent DNA ligase [Acidimicrobiia bacterium]|nr:ATP-dependent DNA ligase [Acidimicrobiia bacterium]